MRRPCAPQSAGLATVVVLGLLASCTSTTPGQTALPSDQSFAPTTVAEASPTVRPTGPPSIPSPTLTRTIEPAAPKPTTAPPATTPPPASQMPGRSPFRRVDDFFRPREWVFAVAAGGPGYVAVGLENLPDGDSSEGRVWTSVDGRTWARQRTDMTNGYLEEVIEFKGELYAFGHELEGIVGIGPGTVWRSPDGVTWTQAAVMEGASGHWMDVAATDDRLFAVNSTLGDPRTWVSSDGSDWTRPQGDPPARYYLGTLGSTVVAAGTTSWGTIGLAATVSNDDGATWEDVSIQSDYEFEPDFVANNGILLAATRACCVVPDVPVGLPLTTRDGFNWSIATQPHLSPADAAVAVPGGFLTLSNDGSTALSAEGETWFAGPQMPTWDDDRYLQSATAGGTAVLMVTMDFYNAMQYDRHLWFAPIDAFDMTKWTTPVPLAQPPVTGRAYPATFGYCPTGIRLDGQVWIPSGGTSLETFSGDENGTITLVGADEAAYTSDDGQTVQLEPVHPVPPDPDPGC